MKKRNRRFRWIPRLEAFEDRTMLSGLGVNLGANYQYQGDPAFTNVTRLMGEWGDVGGANWWTADPFWVRAGIWSSGFAFATRAAPTVPPAPARLSTTTCWPIC